MATIKKQLKTCIRPTFSILLVTLIVGSLALIDIIPSVDSRTQQGEQFLLKITTTSDWVAFACLNDGVIVEAFNSTAKYEIITSAYSSHQFLVFYQSGSFEKIIFCIVTINTDYSYSAGKGAIGSGTFEFYSVSYDFYSIQVGSKMLSIEAKTVMGGGKATDGKIFHFPPSVSPESSPSPTTTPTPTPTPTPSPSPTPTATPTPTPTPTPIPASTISPNPTSGNVADNIWLFLLVGIIITVIIIVVSIVAFKKYKNEEAKNQNKNQSEKNQRKINNQTTDDPYTILGVFKFASRSEVVDAYRKLAKEWHPDMFAKHQDPKVWEMANEKFRKIKAAYEEIKRIRGWN